MGCLFSKPSPAKDVRFTDISGGGEPKKYSWDVRREEEAARASSAGGGTTPAGVVRDLGPGSRHVISRGALDGEQLSIESCRSSVIVALDRTDSVTVDLCESCVIVLGPCVGSLFVRDCKDCAVVASCGQLRLRDVRDCTFLLHVGTRPVLETSSGVVFGCFDLGGAWEFPALGSLLARSGRSPYENYWSVPHDFDEATGKGKGAYKLARLGPSRPTLASLATKMHGAGALPTQEEIAEATAAAGGTRTTQITGSASPGTKTEKQAASEGKSKKATADSEAAAGGARRGSSSSSSSSNGGNGSTGNGNGNVDSTNNSKGPADPYTTDVIPITAASGVAADRSRESALVLFPPNRDIDPLVASPYPKAWSLCSAVSAAAARNGAKNESASAVVAATRLVDAADQSRARAIAEGLGLPASEAQLFAGGVACVQISGPGAVRVAREGPVPEGRPDWTGKGVHVVTLGSEESWAFRERLFVQWVDME